MQTYQNDPLTEKIIGLALKVHRNLGPGLLEGIYGQCLCWEFTNAALAFKREVPLPVVYEAMRMDKGHRADVIVRDTVLLELKATDQILPIHEAQTRTYLRLSGCPVALLINFNTVLLKDGIRRFVP